MLCMFVPNVNGFSVRAAERKCLPDAQDFPYMSVGTVGPDIKIWVERAERAIKMAFYQER